jgi:hypothetical protein
MKKLLTVLFFSGLVALAFNTNAKNSYLTKTVAELNEMVGKYKFVPNEVVENVTITNENGVLKASPGDGNVFELKAVTDKVDTFTISELGANVIFVRDTKQKIIGMKVEIEGATLEASKVVEELKK